MCFARCTAACTTSKSAVGECGSPPVYVNMVRSSGTALMARMTSPRLSPGARPPQVPTRTSRFAPSIFSSSNTMAAVGQPMPVDCTEIGLPSKVPVKPSMPRSPFTCLAPSKNVSAMYLARSGSPGTRTASA